MQLLCGGSRIWTQKLWFQSLCWELSKLMVSSSWGLITVWSLTIDTFLLKRRGIFFTVFYTEIKMCLCCCRTEAPQEAQNCILGGRPLVVQTSPTRWVLGTHLYLCSSWRCWEGLRSASVNFFWRAFQCVCPFHDGWFTSAPAHPHWVFSSFWPKTAWPLCPTLPTHLILP